MASADTGSGCGRRICRGDAGGACPWSRSHDGAEDAVDDGATLAGAREWLVGAASRAMGGVNPRARSASLISGMSNGLCHWSIPSFQSTTSSAIRPAPNSCTTCSVEASSSTPSGSATAHRLVCGRDDSGSGGRSGAVRTFGATAGTLGGGAARGGSGALPAAGAKPPTIVRENSLRTRLRRGVPVVPLADAAWASDSPGGRSAS
jgi:hypothetical protein